MEMKIGTNFHIRSSFSGGGGVSPRRNAYTNSAATQNTNADTFTRSYSYLSGKIENNSTSFYTEHREELEMFTANAKKAVRMTPLFSEIATDTYEGKTKFNFAIINWSMKSTNESISKKLEGAGVPKDVTFEFDFNLNSEAIEITDLSDEKYRENIENVLAGVSTFGVISYASKVMNGYASSLYYPWISKALDRCFEQDINDLYIDENGNLGGVNKNLQAAFNAEKKEADFNALRDYDFPVENNIEDLVKRLVSDENITPNISHMGYDGEQIYTNDGEFKLGKDFDPNLFGEEKYVMRGVMAFFMSFYGKTNFWLNNYEKLY